MGDARADCPCPCCIHSDDAFERLTRSQFLHGGTSMDGIHLCNAAGTASHVGVLRFDCIGVLPRAYGLELGNLCDLGRLV